MRSASQQGLAALLAAGVPAETFHAGLADQSAATKAKLKPTIDKLVATAAAGTAATAAAGTAAAAPPAEAPAETLAAQPAETPTTAMSEAAPPRPTMGALKPVPARSAFANPATSAAKPPAPAPAPAPVAPAQPPVAPPPAVAVAKSPVPSASPRRAGGGTLPDTPSSSSKPLPRKAVALGLQLGRADAHVQHAIATLDDKEASAVTVRTAIETLQCQVRDDAALLLPSHAALAAALCARLNLVLDAADLSIAKRVIALAMDVFQARTSGPVAHPHRLQPSPPASPPTWSATLPHAPSMPLLTTSCVL